MRDANWADLRVLAALEAELFPNDAWSEKSWWAELAARPRRDYVVVAYPDGLAGYAGVDHGGEVADVMTVATSVSARGRGVGRALLTAIERRARVRGAQHMMLEVRADNVAARDLYEGAGYAVIATRERYYRPEGIDALVMRKLLGGKEIRDA